MRTLPLRYVGRPYRWVEKELGRVMVWKVVDLLAVPGSPLQDILLLNILLQEISRYARAVRDQGWCRGEICRSRA